MENLVYLSLEELQAGLDKIRQSPKDRGILKMIVRRPGVEQREVLVEGMLDTQEGLVGDNWIHRGSNSTLDGSAHPGRQITIMNARVISLLAQSQERWNLAGDQLYIDMDLTEANLPAGTRLKLGEAVIEITDQPHTGCYKFSNRFGPAALKFISSDEGNRLRMRGIYARVVQNGAIHTGDMVTKIRVKEAG